MQFVGRKTDYAELLKEIDKDAEGRSRWEKMFLQPQEDALNSKIAQADYKTDYDISGAFAAYKNSTKNITDTNIWSGKKAEIGDHLKSNYMNQFQQAQANRMNSYSGAIGDYNDTLMKNNAELQKKGEEFSTFERTAYDYYKTLDIDFDPTNPDMMSKYYDIDGGNINLNDDGIDFWDKLLNATPEGGESFEKYLYENNSKMYDFYQENKGDIREAVGGLKRDDFEYSENERQTKLKADAAEQKAKATIVTSGVDVVVPSDKKFDTEEEREEYFEKVTKKINRHPKVKILMTDADANLNDTDWGEEITTVINGVTYTNVLPGLDDLTDLAFQERTYETMPGYEAGDIYSKDGENYMYMTDKGYAVPLYTADDVKGPSMSDLTGTPNESAIREIPTYDKATSTAQPGSVVRNRNGANYYVVEPEVQIIKSSSKRLPSEIRTVIDGVKYSSNPTTMSYAQAARGKNLDGHKVGEVFSDDGQVYWYVEKPGYVVRLYKGAK